MKELKYIIGIVVLVTLSATEAACMILRIDDVIAISGGPSGGPPGM